MRHTNPWIEIFARPNLSLDTGVDGISVFRKTEIYLTGDVARRRCPRRPELASGGGAPRRSVARTGFPQAAPSSTCAALQLSGTAKAAVGDRRGAAGGGCRRRIEGYRRRSRGEGCCRWRGDFSGGVGVLLCSCDSDQNGHRPRRKFLDSRALGGWGRIIGERLRITLRSRAKLRVDFFFIFSQAWNTRENESPSWSLRPKI